MWRFAFESHFAKMMGGQMPKQAKQLSALEVKRLSAEGLHFVGEVPGLALQVSATGAKSWVLRVMVLGRRRDLGLGGYPEVSLAVARDKARDFRQQIREGIDPAEAARAKRLGDRAAAMRAVTFADAARQYIESHRSGWKNKKHAMQWENTLASYAVPHIGSLAVGDIGVAHVLEVLEQQVTLRRSNEDAALAVGATAKTARLWEARTETATRVRQRIELILDWCKGRGLRSGDNPAAWKGCLDAQLPNPNKLKRVEHHPAVPFDEVGGFMSELRTREGTAARALEFTILTVARSDETRSMRWAEVDLDAGVWTVPASRMKAGREHRVPLSQPAQSLLRSLPRCEGVEYVFPGKTGKALSNMTMTAVMRRMGREEVPHGFRSTFRDWASERTSYSGEMAEAALAHVIKNAVEAAYRRGDQMEKRSKMMNDWAAFCGTPSPRKANVVGIRAKTLTSSHAVS